MTDVASLPDYYDILAVPESAGFAEIKHAYRAAAKRNHPDAGGSPAAMKALNEAYAVLSDVDRRARYDAERRVAVDIELSDDVPLEEVTVLYQDAATVARAEELRAEAMKIHDHRQSWARQSSAATLSGGMLWSVVSLVLGFLLLPQLNAQIILLWGILNALFFGAIGFGIVGMIWPEHRLEILDLSYRRQVAPSRRWWRRTGYTVLAASAASAAITLAAWIASRQMPLH